MFTRFLHRKEWALVTVAVAMTVCMVFLDIHIPEYMEKITDGFLQDRNDVVIDCGTGMIVCAFGSLVISLGIGYVIARMAASVGRNIRIGQFEKVQAFAAQDINRFSAASLVTRSTNDVYQIQTMIARGTLICVKAPILSVWAVSKLYGKEVEWLAITLVGLLVIVVVMGTVLYFATPLFKKIQGFTDDVNRSVRESLEGIRVIRAYNAENYQMGRFRASNDRLLGNNLRTTRIMAPAHPVVSSANNFITLAVYWSGAGIIVSAGTEREAFGLFTDMIVITSYTAMVITAIMLIVGIFRMLPRARVGMKRIEEVIDTEPSVKDGTRSEGTPGHGGEVEFRNVSFTYPGAREPVLRDISFRIDPGKTLAIIGSTGSGKSTLVNLITRFSDATEGEVYVDGTDVRDYALRDLRLRLGYVPQSPVIFSGSVRMNVNYGYGSENRTDDDVWRALRIAQADSFVSAMPEKLDSHISQYGRNISGGQKQRISVARAVCRSPGIFVLDDSFSALDYKTDRDLRRALKSETSGSTVIIVAQRIGTIMDADEIIVLDEGRIVGKGKHEDLLKECSVYRDIAKSQLEREGPQ